MSDYVEGLYIQVFADVIYELANLVYVVGVRAHQIQRSRSQIARGPDQLPRIGGLDQHLLQIQHVPSSRICRTRITVKKDNRRSTNTLNRASVFLPVLRPMPTEAAYGLALARATLILGYFEILGK